MGEKTATKWITEFGSLENLVNRVGEVKGKAGDDLLVGGPGRDTAFGGRGHDTCRAEVRHSC